MPPGTRQGSVRTPGKGEQNKLSGGRAKVSAAQAHRPNSSEAPLRTVLKRRRRDENRSVFSLKMKIVPSPLQQKIKIKGKRPTACSSNALITCLSLYTFDMGKALSFQPPFQLNSGEQRPKTKCSPFKRRASFQGPPLPSTLSPPHLRPRYHTSLYSPSDIITIIFT